MGKYLIVGCGLSGVVTAERIANKLNYKVLNCSKLICINHYDRLSIVKNVYGISKGNVSKKNATKIGCLDTYMFLKQIDYKSYYLVN